MCRRGRGDFRIGEIFRVLAELQGGWGANAGVAPRRRGLSDLNGEPDAPMASNLKLVLRAASCDAVLVEDAFDPECGARLVAH